MARKLSSLRYAMSRMARTEIVDIPQPYKSIVLIEVVVDETPYEVAIDQSPYVGINDECAERCLLYFKRHHRLEGYPHDNVLPGGFAPMKHEVLHRHLHQLRRRNRLVMTSPPGSVLTSPRRVGARHSGGSRFGFEGGTQRAQLSEKGPRTKRT
jgi:hypothetical protein